MIEVIISLVGVGVVVAFAAGYALGYNKAKHPEKVDAQVERAKAEVKSIFGRK